MDKNDEGKIILFPDYEELKRDIAKLRTELSMLATEKDELLFVECKNIEMIYMLNLGALEFNVYKAQCKLLRLKRKVELIQTKINRQEKIDIKSIENTLDIEFAEYQAKLDEKINSMNNALKRNNAATLSPKDAKELKKLYRNIVKALHPDLNPNQSEANMNLFHNAVIAYENGDLNALRIIFEMIVNNDNDIKEIDTMKQMTEEKERLSALLNVLKEEIEEIKASYPYTLKEYIKDDETIERNKEELNESISELNDSIKIYENKITEMTR